MSVKTPIIVTNATADVPSAPDIKNTDACITKLSSKLLAQNFTASDPESDGDVSESDNDNNLVDPNDTLEVSKARKTEESEEEGKFRGRPSSCVFVAR